MTAAPLLTSGAGRVADSYIQHGQLPALNRLQSSADLDRALGSVEPNYFPYGRATKATGSAAISSTPIAIINGANGLVNGQSTGERALGAVEMVLGALPLAIWAREELAVVRSELAAARSEARVVVESESAIASETATATTVQERVAELRSAIPENSQGRITMAVGVVEDSAGQQSVLIGTSEPRGYLRPGVQLAPGESVVAGTGHAEADIVAHATANNLKLVSIGATRRVCEGCQQAIAPTAAEIVTPLKKPKN